MLRQSAIIAVAAAFAFASGCQRPHPADSPRALSPECISLLGRPLYAEPLTNDRAALETNLSAARAALAADPNNPDLLIWVGRRLGYLWRMRDAIDVFSRGADRFPDDARFLRHRGHRYISIRRFDLAILDLTRAAALSDAQPDAVEPDGIRNAANLPLTTLKFNIWYHLGVAFYLTADFQNADRAFARAGDYSRGHDDNLIAVADWRYMSLRRLGRTSDAAAVLAAAPQNPRIIENHAYARRIEMYRGLVDPQKLLLAPAGRETADVTVAYGAANWCLYNGDPARAARLFEQIAAGPNWPAFAFIAAEADRARMSQPPPASTIP